MYNAQNWPHMPYVNIHVFTCPRTCPIFANKRSKTRFSVFICTNDTLAPCQYPIRRLKCKISWSLETARFVCSIDRLLWIWRAHRQHCCRRACQISKRCDNLNYQSRGFETSRDFIGHWNRSLLYLNTHEVSPVYWHTYPSVNTMLHRRDSNASCFLFICKYMESTEVFIAQITFDDVKIHLSKRRRQIY